MQDHRYPIGKFDYAGPYTATERAEKIEAIGALPDSLERAVAGLTPLQLATPYREGGWRVRQVVHHLADSHMHIYLRFKFALAEDGAAISAYPEELWADLPDSDDAPLSLSLPLVRGVHAKWHFLLERMTEADFDRGFTHPQNGRVTLDRAVGAYDWHGRHHVAHIASLRQRMGW